MALNDIAAWLDENSGPSSIWFLKRLSANDTLANNAHQAGPYIPKPVLFDLFPHLHRPDKLNPKIRFNLILDSHPDRREVTATWYNNRIFGGTRNETRLTGFGGSSSALLDPESTGALTVFSFHLDENDILQECHVWVCRHSTEEDIVEEKLGPVEPGKWILWSEREDLFGLPPKILPDCWLKPELIPPHWLSRFPTGAEIVQKVVELRPASSNSPDSRLIQRRDCEYEMFRSLEEAVELPLIKSGFDSVNQFLAHAQTMIQRRKARSGRSLELHARTIFLEEGLEENSDFSHQPESDPGHRPDFLFPSEVLYKDPSYPESRLRMLAVKTTCKDRWRQILTEAKRVKQKHLLTLQEGISENQFREMVQEKVQLVVPAPIVDKFPKQIRADLQTFESFIGDLRLLRN